MDNILVQELVKNITVVACKTEQIEHSPSFTLLIQDLSFVKQVPDPDS